MKTKWIVMTSNDCVEIFDADSVKTFFFRKTVVIDMWIITNLHLDCSMKSSDVHKCCAYVAKHTAVMTP